MFNFYQEHFIVFEICVDLQNFEPEFGNIELFFAPSLKKKWEKSCTASSPPPRTGVFAFVGVCPPKHWHTSPPPKKKSPWEGGFVLLATLASVLLSTGAASPCVCVGGGGKKIFCLQDAVIFGEKNFFWS